MITGPGNSLSDSIGHIFKGLPYLTPEIGLAAGVVIFLFLSFIKSISPKVTLISSLVLLVSILFMDFQQWVYVRVSAPTLLFGNVIRLDIYAVYFKILFELAGILTILLTYFYTSRLNHKVLVEYFTFIVAISLGAHFMAMANNLLVVFISMELISISSYILTGFLFNKKGAEAGIKYLLFGALSTGFMLYGMSLLYGFTGTLDLDYAFLDSLRSIPFAPLLLSFLLTLSGFAFKISSVPFHLWAPDVYEGTPTPIVAFFSVVPKAAGLVVLSRFFALTFASFPWFSEIIGAVALLSMFVGNLSALNQKNFKRMLAYSSIAHSGFILLGIISVSSFGLSSMAFYITIYLVMNFGAFFTAQILENISGSGNMEDFKGLGLQNAYLGVSILVIMVSLAGLPPTAGFFSKLFIFTALLQTYQETSDLFLLSIFILGLLNVVISLFYYLKVPYLMFFKTNQESLRPTVGWKENISLALLIFPLLFLFFKSEELMNIINFIGLNFN